MKTKAFLCMPIFLMSSTLAPVPACAAEQQQQQKKPQPVRKQETRQPTLDANKGENINANKGGTPKTDAGVSGGNTQAKAVPGASPTTSGNYKGPQQADTPALPGGALYDPKSARPGNAAPSSEGKTVTPGDFSREKQIKDVTDTKGALTEQPKGSNPISDRANANPLDTTNMGGPGRGEGRNTVDKTGQQSITGSTDRDKSTVTLKGNRGEVEFKLSKDGTKLERETITVKDKDSTITLVKDYETKVTTTTITMANGQTMQQINGGKWTDVKTKTPNPENDTGDGHTPKGVATASPLKSPAEIEAERKRQATLRPDDQTRQLERMRMDAETALKSAADMRTAGRIDPGPGDGTTGSGIAPAGSKPPANPGPQSGRPQNSSKGGVRPACPADNPTC